MSIGRQDNPAGHWFNRILAVFAAAVLLLGTTPASAQRISPLGDRHDWSELDTFQGTMSRAEFECLLLTIYAPTGGWDAYIKIEDERAKLVTDSKNPDKIYELRFIPNVPPIAPDARAVIDLMRSAGFVQHDVPGVPSKNFWRTRGAIGKQREKAPPPKGRPLEGLRVALDPGHLGGEWARMEERWFQIGDAPPVKEGEMTLAVANLIAPRLEALGATVLWVRREIGPVTAARPDKMIDTARDSLVERGVTDAKDTYSGPGDPEREKSVQWEAEKLFYRISEIRTRARLVNDVLRPDVTLCLHFNAEDWGDPAKPALVEKNHLHMLVSGNYGPPELRYDDVRFEMLLRLLSRVHEEEIPLAGAVGGALAAATGLPPYEYTDNRAIRVGPSPYTWARNLLANRLYRCPVIYCEPYVMNSPDVFARVQAGDYEGLREVAGKMRPSIVREYADAVIVGLLNAYGSTEK